MFLHFGMSSSPCHFKLHHQDSYGVKLSQASSLFSWSIVSKWPSHCVVIVSLLHVHSHWILGTCSGNPAQYLLVPSGEPDTCIVGMRNLCCLAVVFNALWSRTEQEKQQRKAEVPASVNSKYQNCPLHHSCESSRRKLITCDPCCWFFMYFHVALWEKQVLYACMQASGNRIWFSSLHWIHLECINISKPHVTDRSHENWLFPSQPAHQYNIVHFYTQGTEGVSRIFLMNIFRMWILTHLQNRSLWWQYHINHCCMCRYPKKWNPQILHTVKKKEVFWLLPYALWPINTYVNKGRVGIYLVK